MGSYFGGIGPILQMFIVAAALLSTSCRTPGIIDESLQKSDAIVLLAGNRSERVPAAAALFLYGYAKTVILTNDGVGGGWSKKHNRNLTVIEWTEEELNSLGVPRSSIVKLAILPERNDV